MAAPPTQHGETLKGHADPLQLDGAGLPSLVRRAVRQVSSEETVDQILADGLRRAEHDAIPLDAGPLTTFVLGPLFDAVLHALGVDEAVRVVRILKPLLQKRAEIELGSLPPVSDRKKTVLIVDDDINVRAQLLSILSGAGHSAISAPDGNVALAMSVRCRPDLVISELRTGALRGRQLATLLKVAFHDDAPPLIILTDDPTLASAEGVCVLMKPIDRAEALAAVESLLGITSRAG